VPRSKLQEKDIDWERVRRLARQSFKNGNQSPEDFQYMNSVFQLAPDAYRKVTEEVRAEERRALMAWGRS
jgi:hypothetical protein